MSNNVRIIWISGLAASLLFVGVFYYLGYRPAIELIRESHIDRITKRAMIHRLLLDTEIENAIQSARSISSRSMIRNKIIDYKKSVIDLNELRSYTREKYKEGVRTLDKFHSAVRVVGKDTIVSEGPVVYIDLQKEYKDPVTYVTISDDVLIVDVISPIKTKNGEIVGYDQLRTEDRVALKNIRGDEMNVVIKRIDSGKADVFLGIDNVVVENTDQYLKVSIASSAGPFSYIFVADKSVVLRPFNKIQIYSKYIVVILVLLFVTNVLLLRKYLNQRHHNTTLGLRDKVRSSKEHFEEIFAMSPAGIVITDENGFVKKANTVICDLLSTDEENLKDRSFFREFMKETNGEGDHSLSEISVNTLNDKVMTLLKPNGEQITLLISARRLDHVGEVRYIVVAVDITEIRKSKRLLEGALEEKKVLIAEIHHRVKNNLAMICGLLHLQVSGAEDASLRTALMDSLNRVKTIADVHEITYKSDSLSEVDIRSNIKSVISRLKQVYDKEDHIPVDLEIKNFSLNLSKALPISQLVNEVISDLLCYGFPDKKLGEIQIQLHKNDELVMLSILITSKSAAPDLFAQNQLGAKLTEVLAEQLDSAVVIKESTNRLSIHMDIPLIADQVPSA